MFDFCCLFEVPHPHSKECKLHQSSRQASGTCKLTKFGDSQMRKLGISYQAVLVNKLFLFNSSSLVSDKWWYLFLCWVL